MGDEAKIGALADTIKDDLVDSAKSVLKEITDGDKEFFKDLGMRYAKAYYKKKTGNEEAAKESIEALDVAMGSMVAERGLDFAEGGEKILLGVLKTVGKMVLTMALA